MDWRHLLVLAGVFVLGFVVAKKYPTLFSGIPGINAVTG